MNRPFNIGDVVMYGGMNDELFEVRGIDLDKQKILLHGDWSQYGYPPVSDWVDMNKVYHTKRVRA
jgi:hypothetical protein